MGPAPLTVFGPPGWEDAIGVAVQPYPPERRPYAAVDLEDRASYSVGSLTVHARAVQHGVPTFGARMEAAGRSIAYSADTSACQAVRELAAEADLFLCEATLPAARRTAISMNAAEAAQLAETAQASHLLLTHLLPDTDRQEALETAQRAYADPIALAAPGMMFTVEQGDTRS